MMRWLAMVLIALTAAPAGAQTSRIFRDWSRDAARSPLPDFSYAGYARGESAPPVVDGPIFEVTDFGAVPDDGQDDIAAIQRAIDAAEKAGGGVVRFPKGVFDFDKAGRGGFLRIRAGNIVLRGAGSGADGTILHDHAFSNSPDPRRTWLANTVPSFVHAGPFDLAGLEGYGYGPERGEVLTTIDPAPRNARQLTVDNPANLRVGQTVLLAMTDPDGSLVRELTAPMTRVARAYQGVGVQRFQQLVTIERIDGKRITIDAPIRWQLEQRWAPSLHAIRVIEQVGIESIRMRTNWRGPFRHHASVEGNDGWNHIRFDQVRSGWVRDVVHDGTTMAVMLASTKNCTVMNGRIEGPQGHNGYVVIGCATDNLFVDLDGATAFHTFQIQGNPVGNVFLRCRGDEPSAIDSHGGLGVATLFDSCVGLVFSGGGADNNVPPRHAHGLVLWNWQVGRRNPYNGREQPMFAKINECPGFIAVGVRGRDGQALQWQDAANKSQSRDADVPGAYVESLGEPVEPASLYEAQLQQRLRSRPRSR